MIVVSESARMRAQAALLLTEQVRRLKRLCLFKTRLMLFGWFLIPLAVSYMLPPMPLPISGDQVLAYVIWVAFALAFVYLLIRANRKEYYPDHEDHLEDFPVGYQPSFWQWFLYCDLRDDLKAISDRLGIWPSPTMAMKSFYPGHFGMVTGTESPGQPACVMLPTTPSFVQWAFSRRAHCATLLHECGHIILSTRWWTIRFDRIYFALAIPMTILFAKLAGQFAALMGCTVEEWHSLSKIVFLFHVPFAAYMIYGFWGARILSRIHEYCCDAIAVAGGEAEGILENLHGFIKYTNDWLAKKSSSYRFYWSWVKRPYGAAFGTHPSNSRRVRSCRRYMSKGYGAGF